MNEFTPRDRNRTEAFQVFGVDLAIDLLVSPTLQLPDQRDKCHLGGIRHPREHRLAEEHVTQRQPV